MATPVDEDAAPGPGRQGREALVLAFGAGAAVMFILLAGAWYALMLWEASTPPPDFWTANTVQTVDHPDPLTSGSHDRVFNLTWYRYFEDLEMANISAVLVFADGTQVDCVANGSSACRLVESEPDGTWREGESVLVVEAGTDFLNSGQSGEFVDCSIRYHDQMIQQIHTLSVH